MRFEFNSAEREFKRAYHSSGNLIKNSWVNGNDGYSYADSSGVLLKGRQEIEGNTYYFGRWYRTAVVDGDNTLIDGKRYYFTNDGEAKLTGLNTVDGKK
nr:hypothetical protein [Bacillus cereus]